MLKEKVSVFLTVGNKKQKVLCEKLLSTVPPMPHFDISVVSDDDCGRRLGSGGAVLNIVRNHYKSGEKMLIINSGGMSKRSVNYAIRSKAFANASYKGETLTLLEMILKNAYSLIDGFSSGILVCCSDIVVMVGKESFLFSNNTVISMKTDFLTASRHGVMLCDEYGKMTDYLHKRSPDYLERVADEREIDGMLIDTGITYFTDEFSTELKRLASNDNFEKLFFCGKTEINLYSDIISLLSLNAQKQEYLETETMDSEHLEVKKLIFDRLSAFTMDVCLVDNQDFLHFGSLAEARNNIVVLSGNSDKSVKLHSYTDAKTTIGEGTVLDGAQLNGCCVGNGCIISDITLDNCVVNDRKSIFGVRLQDGSYVTLVCDVDENPKNLVENISFWDSPRYYKAESFTKSFEKLYSEADEEKYSMDYCMKNADFDYYFTHSQYLCRMDSYTVSEDYLKRRQEIIACHFDGREKSSEIRCIKDRVKVSLPLRINLSGTWTDAMPYCVDNGGQVINVAVTLDGKKPVEVTVERLKENHVEFCSDQSVIVFDNNYENEEDISDFNLHRAALQTVGIGKDTKILDGFRLTTRVNDVDKGSGLGTSSILLGGCIMALSEMFGFECDEGELLRSVFVAEQIMNTGGGWQDQVGGLTPGIKSGSALPGTVQNITVEYIELPECFEKLFAERIVLMPTGQRHFGRFIVNDVVNRYLSRNATSLKGHKEIWKLNDKLVDVIKSEDLNGFYDVVNTHRKLLEMISPKVTNPILESIIDICMEKAEAISPLGAGGGGYLLVVLKEDVSVQQFKSYVAEKLPSVKSSVKKIDICRS